MKKSLKATVQEMGDIFWAYFPVVTIFSISLLCAVAIIRDIIVNTIMPLF